MAYKQAPIVRKAFWILLLSIIDPLGASDSLDAVLLEDMIPLGSKKCSSLSKQSNQKTTYTFKYQKSPSAWSEEATKVEEDLFLAEMSHLNSENANKSWSIRVGQGGNIYSFRGAYGEAVPPQNHPGSIFVDEVTQSVSVHMNEKIGQYYIQQAGGYLDEHDKSELPVFSPTIAQHCQNEQCGFASWGQKADIRTKFESNILYFNSYRDCGEGVIQFSTVIHNTGNIDGSGDDVTYLNVPWGGVRQSTLRDIFRSSPDGQMHLDYPPKFFTPGRESILNPNDTGGYTTFTEQVVVPKSIYDEYPFELPDDMHIVLADEIAGHYSKSNSLLAHKYCISARIEPVPIEHKDGCLDCDLSFTNKRTGDSIEVRMVLHWAWKNSQLYFCPENIDAGQFNAIFKKNDEIIVSRRNVGKPMEDNLALTFVHGFQSPLAERYASSRIHWGKCGDASRDFTVFTCNTRVAIKPGDTYFYQQYIVTGELMKANETASEWVDEVHEDIFHSGELTGTDIYLYSTDDKTFGVHVEGQTSCLRGVSRCQGKSVPGFGLSALFAIRCGDQKYVGFDKYVFAPYNDVTKEHISSQCKGIPSDVSPDWKLLGFFEKEKCDYLHSAAYESNFCSTPVATNS